MWSMECGDPLLKRYSRPSLQQVNAIVNFVQEHPILVQSKRKNIPNQKEINKLWIEMSNKVNSMDGVAKPTKTWVKYWMDKKRYVLVKNRQLQTGKSDLRLSILEKKILKICLEAKENGYDTDDMEENDHNLNNEHSDSSNSINSHNESSEAEQKFMNMVENMVDVMEQQANTFTQMAQTWYSHSSAMEKIADASYQQAVAVGRLANSFESIEVSVLDMKNAVVSIDDTLKRSLTPALPDPHHVHLFS